MRIVYTRNALRQLDEILIYIEERSPQGASRVKARIEDLLALLTKHASVGQTTSRAGQRRLVISPYPYAMFYRVKDDMVIVQRIRHTARRSIQTVTINGHYGFKGLAEAAADPPGAEGVCPSNAQAGSTSTSP